jgi:preprotein translocase subunit SecY
MVATILSAFTVAEIRKKVLFTAALLAIYRLGAHIPVPGVNIDAVNSVQQQFGGGGILNLLNTFSGGGLSRIAVFALGIMPYITASIILQLLTVVVPSLEKLSKEGEVGQARITQYTRYLTVGLAFAQAIGYVFLFKSFEASAGEPVIKNFNAGTLFLIVIVLTAGCVVVMWMGELITQRGIGNGMSLLIFASVVSTLPNQGSQIKAAGGVTALVLTIAVFIVLLVAIVFVEQGQRRIPVQFAKRVVGRRMYGGQSTYIPLKVNQAGVIPIIFASSVLYLPQLISGLLPADGWGQSVQQFVNDHVVKPNAPLHLLIFGSLIVGFAYFYTAITFDPVKQADQLRKQGGFIPGIRPGPQTERYLGKILSRITLPGALFIACVALIPSLLLTSFLPGAQVSFAGTSILIAVGVALETMKQIDSQLMMRNYEGFLK